MRLNMYRALELDVNGRLIRGCLRAPEGEGPFPTVIFFHGFTVDKVGMMRLHELFARECVKAGFACVRFDFYGCGESDGDFNEMTVGHEIEEGKAIYEWCQKQPFCQPENVFLTGHSMGGLVTGCLAPVLQPKAIVLWAPALNMYYGAAVRARTMKGPTEHGWDINGLELSRTYLDEIRKMDTLAMSRGYHGKVLLVHGTEDELVQVDVAYQYQDVYGDKMQLELIEGSNHQFSSLAWKQRVYDLTTTFLRRQIEG